MSNLLIAQSGGPTSAINATVAGIIEEAKNSGKVNKILGAINGIQGVINENFIEINNKIKTNKDLEYLCQTPGAALGSCRFRLGKLDNSQYEKIIDVFRKNDISYFIYIGGNDSMDTVDKIFNYCKKNNINDISIVGAPKTIDNDLVETDHCPGFGSAAKYVATSIAELERDCNVYSSKSVTIVEVMGRNTGWLAAASALVRLNSKGPDLIYLCESDFDKKKFINDVRSKLKVNNSVLVVVSEGIKDKLGRYISEGIEGNDFVEQNLVDGKRDAFGHKYIAGAGSVLEKLVFDEIKCKVRSVELSLMQRCAGHVASKTDIEESRLVGKRAFKEVIAGSSGVMISILRRSNNPYSIELSTVEVCKVSNNEKRVPNEFISKSGNDVTDEMVKYLTPLIQGERDLIYENGLPKHIYLY